MIWNNIQQVKYLSISGVHRCFKGKRSTDEYFKYFLFSNIGHDLYYLKYYVWARMRLERNLCIMCTAYLRALRDNITIF